MTLHPPFAISARLLPALQIGKAWLSWEGPLFFLDTPEFEYVIDDFRPGPGYSTQQCFEDILCFMAAAAESRAYRMRTGEEGENENLFPTYVVDWIMSEISEIECLQCDLEQELLIEGE